ncbi:MAG: MlaD family protein [Opitutae bacterium]
MKNAANSTLVGAFTLGGALIFLGFLFFTGGLSSWRDDNEKFVIVFNENVFGLNEGGKVTFNGVKIGRVQRFFIGDALEEGPVPVMIEINRKLVDRHRVTVGNEIFEADGSFKAEIIPFLVGQLVQESFVTGILYVNLITDFDQSESNESQHHLYGYPQIRSKGSIFAELSESINLEKLSQQVSEFLQTATLQLNNLHTDELRDAFLTLSKTTNQFIENFSQQFSPLSTNLGKTSDQVRSSFQKLDAVNQRIQDALAPDSDLRFGAVNALHDLSEMSKSLKSLSDLLERNPQALIRGKINTED